ncbi:MAG: hypothetical protein ABFR82_13315 [Nitrospirota bacterium]
MKNNLSKYISGILLILMLISSSCATRGIHDKYLGATEQRLITQSIDKLIKKLPEQDFSILKGKKIYLECYFLEDSEFLKYAKKRIELELMEKYNGTLFAEPESADMVLHVFFNAIGTDQDKAGFKTPDFIIPGVGGAVSIDIITLDMYHGISELYYYIIDQKNMVITRGEKIRSTVRTDKLSFPIISIPINTLD